MNRLQDIIENKQMGIGLERFNPQFVREMAEALLEAKKAITYSMGWEDDELSVNAIARIEKLERGE